MSGTSARRLALVLEGVVRDIVETAAPLGPPWWIETMEPVRVGWLYDGERFAEPPPAPDERQLPPAVAPNFLFDPDEAKPETKAAAVEPPADIE